MYIALYSLRQQDMAEFESKVKEVVDRSGPRNVQSNREREDYFMARRSLRLWPVSEVWKAQSLDLGSKEFMMITLDMPEDVVNGVTIDIARRIQQPRRTRDTVHSYAVNLARHKGEAGICLEIPPHLTGTFRLFE